MEVKAPRSSSYREYLMSSLKEPERAAGYIETFLELEEGDEPEYLSSVLKDVIEAIAQINPVLEEVKSRYEKLDRMLSETKGAEIYALVELLDALGYRIAIAPK
ncbi:MULTISPECIES: transcriptional regulator [unclassified Microcoleus]|uniref:transcriptional regulator n=2 Tax=unclassified Microcoleus TaxID=2642155 RepID=UPI002FD4E180